MTQLFKNYPEAIKNTIEVSNKCNVEIPLGKLYLPNFPIPKKSNSQNPDEYLKELCYDSIPIKYQHLSKQVEERLNYELNIIKKMGFASYFLITQDFVRYANTRAIDAATCFSASYKTS